MAFLFLLFLFLLLFFFVNKYYYSKQIYSSSSSSTNTMIPQKKYEVFLSFRGEDTRNNFISHLYEALRQKGIETFIDDQLIRGDEISESLLNTIEGSTISIVIFSEGYASSRWCLDELVKILECRDKYEQIVIPVFYRVDPSHVRHQAGTFGVGFSKLEERFKERVDKLQNWRIALREAASLSGFDSHVIRSEYKLIGEVVNDVWKKINDKFQIDNKDQLIGVESRILEIESMLNVGPKNICIMGIWGIGGIGKTTIADAVFRKISSCFDGSCFIENVREESKKIGGLAPLLLSTLLKDENVKMDIVNIGYSYRRLSRKRVLIVFDNVTRLEQIEFLIENLHNLSLGSRIIITTRDKHVLENCGVDKMYEMKELVDIDALKLFSRYAFKRNHPSEGYEDLSEEVMQHAHGLPLALKVLGCYLFGKSKSVWGSAIDKMKIIPHNEIQKVLKVSYDDLDDTEKKIFLDIACFFKGAAKGFVQKLMDASDLFFESGISTLIDRSLINISDHNIITMHDLLQKMGREIVRQESDNPEERSRLWYHKDIYQVLRDNTGTKKIQGISLDMSEVEEMSLNFRTFEKMRNLRFLRFYGKNKFKIFNCEVSGSVLTKLRYFEWEGYPLATLPSNILVENLVSIRMPYSKVEQLWDGTQNLVNLKAVDLRDSNRLRKLPDLSLARNLEELDLAFCSSLVETHPSIQYLEKLVLLNLFWCRSLKSLPPSIDSESLQNLYLSQCSNLKRLPEILSCNLKHFSFSGTGIEEFPLSSECLSRLDSLKFLSCSRLRRLPNELGDLEALNSLYVVGSIIELPSSILRLKNLKVLSFKGCRIHELKGFILPSLLSSGGMHSLTTLQLVDCGITELPENLDQLSTLRTLNLAENNFETIPESIINLSPLETLDLHRCRRLRSFPKLPCSLTSVNANRCTILERLSGLLIPTSSNSCYFYLRNCFKLDRNDLRKLVEDSLQKIKLNLQTYGRDRYGMICFPGSEIPECFEYRNMGSSIKLELPSAVWNNKLVRFAYCLIVAFRGYDECNHGRFLVCCEWKFKSDDDDWHVDYNSDSEYFESDHVVFGCELYSKRGHDFGESSRNTVFIQFALDPPFVEVKKCGIHLFYSKDFEESKKIAGEVSIDEEEETHLQPKRLNYTSSS